MTYQKIFDLKFKKKVSTVELQKYFPNENGKICKIALMELPEKTLKKLVPNKRTVKEVIQLKKSLEKKSYS
ncbi:MAG: hypothetical protein COV74_08320 [Candidatus Omnitrophica bacterium CG11_big_fil_rev_8_21_14_0_20_45_26]|uniref:Uncharacterized protein n=1 Tax=Candidatus Abzuiibacterium crystallinum TaxID=1974748 RepID=A0A2H0LPQ8_9BACT|nr:MAG: hypothetical protein COV74_08320 [Candidatus Omnitrophica bacterium CG11_big_fil_rev_8_21_14_0_20_45_26]PIW63666.1 MAG: hypothetical protein COW12_09205 [Candidatus Omnitrophica bacterium CG12_big_fil_rev_8_21_14_0_65_45_16]